MSPRIALLPGDGVGPDVVAQAAVVLDAVSQVSGTKFELVEGIIGGVAIDQFGSPLPAATMDMVRSCEAVLLGAVGGPRWEGVSYDIRPERGLLDLRSGLGVYANLRPARMYSALIASSPLRPEIVRGADLLVVRELTGGIYFGEPRGIEETPEGPKGVNTEVYTAWEIERVARVAFEIAGERRRKVTSVDKANVLESGQVWRRVVTEVGHDYPGVALNHLYVDNCAMQLVRDPRQFDVILTNNMFGDILSDEAAILMGSIGMLPSASLGGKVALYEPVHGSAPDIAGRDVANPFGAVLSVAMMLRHSFRMEREASMVERAVERVLDSGYRTLDIRGEGTRQVGTRAMGGLIADEILKARAGHRL